MWGDRVPGLCRRQRGCLLPHRPLYLCSRSGGPPHAAVLHAAAALLQPLAPAGGCTHPATWVATRPEPHGRCHLQHGQPTKLSQQLPTVAAPLPDLVHPWRLYGRQAAIVLVDATASFEGAHIVLCRGCTRSGKPGEECCQGHWLISAIVDAPWAVKASGLRWESLTSHQGRQ